MKTFKFFISDSEDMDNLHIKAKNINAAWLAAIKEAVYINLEGIEFWEAIDE